MGAVGSLLDHSKEFFTEMGSHSRGLSAGSNVAKVASEGGVAGSQDWR